MDESGRFSERGERERPWAALMKRDAR